ncbi:hypothetical protein CB1_001326032 [Camelus ferus]|nr:hypothetical protein CB1_001326032 [Camelus ferus]
MGQRKRKRSRCKCVCLHRFECLQGAGRNESPSKVKMHRAVRAIRSDLSASKVMLPICDFLCHPHLLLKDHATFSFLVFCLEVKRRTQRRAQPDAERACIRVTAERRATGGSTISGTSIFD